MEPDKTIAAIAALIGALTGLITAIIGLVNALRRPDRVTSKEAQTEPVINDQGETPTAERAADRRTSRGSPGLKALMIGGLLLIVSIAGAGLLFFRAPSFGITITKPVTGPLNVRAVDNGTSAEYAVEGTYSGPLEKNYGVYVLVRPGNKIDEAWYLQSQPVILREDSWYRKGEWRLEKAYVGRGPDEPKLVTGEDWEIKAVIAPESPTLRQLDGIEPAELAQKLPSIAESETVKVKLVVNP